VDQNFPDLEELHFVDVALGKFRLSPANAPRLRVSGRRTPPRMMCPISSWIARSSGNFLFSTGTGAIGGGSSICCAPRRCWKSSTRTNSGWDAFGSAQTRCARSVCTAPSSSRISRCGRRGWRTSTSRPRTILSASNSWTTPRSAPSCRRASRVPRRCACRR